MSPFWNAFITFAVHPAAALILAMVLTSGAVKFLPRLKMIDAPRGRHQHEQPVPCGGGVAIALAFFAVMLSLLLFLTYTNSLLAGKVRIFLRYFSLPAFIILAVGLLDDRFELRSIVKLAFQILVGLIFYFEGCGVSLLFRHELPEIVSLIVTIVWCVTIINAFNLIDGLDGLAAGLGAISAFLLVVWQILAGGDPSMTVVLLCFCMSSLGFLRYNFSPAKIFMGDTGSMFLGLFFAYVSMHYSTKAVTFTALMVPLAAVGVPVFDVFLAVWRRTLRKYISKDSSSAIMQGDHDHLHHRILKETGKTRKTALIIYGLSITLSLLAMLSEFFHERFSTLTFVTLLIGLSAVIRYSNIELYDTLSSVVRGVNAPHCKFMRAALHPGLDALFVLAAVFLSNKVYGKLLPFTWDAWWYLLFLVPFVFTLWFSGIYRTFWLRAGVLQYYRLMRLLFAAGVAGYILSGLIWYYGMKLDGEKLFSASGCYFMFWLLAAGSILTERFLIHYYESFGFRRLFIRNQGRNAMMRRVLIYGGGLACRLYVNSVYCSFAGGKESEKIVGIMDDDPLLKKLNIYSFRVYGGVDEISEIHKNLKFDKVVIACEKLHPENLEKLKTFCRSNGLELKKFECVEKEV